MHFDYDQRNGTYLVIILDPIQSKQLVPHQLQMLLNNQIPQLLKVELDNNNDTYQLQYDLTSKKRLFQVLQTCPPTIQMFYEMAFRLVQTIANSTMYMLNEEQYVLHGDFIYCGRDVADLYVCYLPIPSVYSVSMEHQLRLLLLRMLASVDGLNGETDGIIKLMNVLQDEDYLIPDLKDVLKDAWMKQVISTDKPIVHVQNLITNPTNQSNDKHHIWFKIKNLWNKPRKRESHPTKLDTISINSKPPITGVTSVLVNKQDTMHEEIKIIVNKHGVEEVIHFHEDRFIVGRNQAGVHYTDTTEGISRVHCEFVKFKDQLEIKDLGSLNGSYLNGEFLIPYKTYPFRFGDVLRIVTTEIRITT
ncbi:MAG: DUF6382 domain-containing protein [Paenibacillaceae bacterium]